MQTRCIYTTINENLTVSTLINDKIFFMSFNTLFMLNIYTGTKSIISEKIKANYIFSYKYDLVLINGNKIIFITQNGDVLKETVLKDAVIGVKDDCILKTINNDLFFIENFAVHKIRIIQKMNEIIADVTLDQTKTIVLTQNGRLFMCEDVVKTRRLLLNKELFRVECKENRILLGVEYKKQRVYLKTDKGIEICKIKNNLLLIICFISNDDDYLLHSYKNTVFYVFKKLYVLEDVPIRICDENVIFLLGNVAVCEDKIIICDEETKNVSLNENIESVLSVDERVRNLFSFITAKDGIYHKEKAISTEEELIEFKKEVEECRSRYIDKLRLIFMELKTLSDSFIHKNDELKNLLNVIEIKNKLISEKRRNILDKLGLVNKSLNVRLDAKLSESEYSMIMFRIRKCREKMKTVKMDKNKEMVRKLKMQRLILRGYIK